MFTTHCPGCESSLNAPDSLKGKKVKCKKCGEPFVARPGDGNEGGAEEKTVRTKADELRRPRRKLDDDPTEEAPLEKRKKPARRAVDEDTEVIESAQIVDADEDYDEEPRPKRKRKGTGKRRKQKSSPVLLFVLIGVGALLVLGGGAVGVYYGLIKEDSKTDTPQANGGSKGSATPSGSGSATSGWVDFAEPEGRFRVKLPRPASAPVNESRTLPNGETIEVKLYKAVSPNDAYVVAFSKMPAAAAGASPDQILDGAVNGWQSRAKNGVLKSNTSITYQGFPGREAVIEIDDPQEHRKGMAILRVILAQDRMILIMVGGDWVRPDAALVKTFFSTLKIE